MANKSSDVIQNSRGNFGWLDIAKAAADTTCKQDAVFVTEAASRAWVGLNGAHGAVAAPRETSYFGV